MNNKIKDIIESGILEEYALGTTSKEQSIVVEQYLKDHYEVRRAYNEIQRGLENLAKVNAVNPPAGLKSRVLDSIVDVNQGSGKVQSTNNGFRLSAIAAIGLLLLSLFLWNQLQIANDNFSQVDNQLSTLKTECDEQATELSRLQSLIDIINNPKTEKVYLAGNSLSPEFETLAYWNKDTKEGYIQVVNMPPLENKQCYQMWADVDGEMLNLGVITAEKGVMAALPFLENAESLNITIEPEGGSDHPNVANLVASQVI